MSLPVIRDPAPHRGFNNKAREVLLDSPKVCAIRRSGSDEEFLRRVGLIRFHRADSEEEEESGSQSSTPGKKKSVEKVNNEEGFDGIDDLPKWEKKLNKMNKQFRTLEQIGKTRSAGDLLKKCKVAKTFQQMNIMKLPSLESEEPEAKPSAEKASPKRTAQYEMQ